MTLVQLVRQAVRDATWLSTYVLVLLPVRVFFGVLLPPLLTFWWHTQSPYHLAQDDEPVYDRVRCVAMDQPYGLHRRETVDIVVADDSLAARVRPPSWRALLQEAVDLLLAYPRGVAYWIALWRGRRTRSTLAPQHVVSAVANADTAVCFFHGGGGVAVDPAIQHHQATFIPRQTGLPVYMFAYPHAPEDAHPAGVLSTLRALEWAKRVQGHARVVLVGESAGGQLVTVAAGLVCNPPALREFAQLVRHVYGMREDSAARDACVEAWDFPEIVGVVSWYGILDTVSFRGKGWLWWGLQFTLDCVREHDAVPWWLVRSRERLVQDKHSGKLRAAGKHEHVVRRKSRQECTFLTLDCMKDLVRSYPPTLLISGTADPLGLVHSSRLARDTLRERGVPCTLLEYDAGHAFIGLNPFVLYVLQGSAWRELGKDATFKTVEFVQKVCRERVAVYKSQG